ncbi:MAG: hypothetical protein J6R20_03785 [Clostridia bacterium]|nr:hypothetical protein [Clostridia bacterium]
MKKLRIISALMVVLLTFLFSGCNNVKEAESFHGVIAPVMVYSDVVIEELSLRSGSFPEDGSFEDKKDVLTLTVRNESDKVLQYLKIKVTTDKKEMFFEITTLTVNMAVNVFEKSGQTLEKDETILEITGENRVDFENAIGLKRQTFELDVHDKVINVRNISKNDIDTDIYLYYKKKDKDGNYFGGITFRTKIDGLKSGELKQVAASHFALTDSEVIFLDYAEV